MTQLVLQEQYVPTTSNSHSRAAQGIGSSLWRAKFSRTLEHAWDDAIGFSLSQSITSQ